MAIIITNIAMDDSEKTWTKQTGCRSVAFHANGGAITMAHESGGATWTLADGDKEQITMSDMPTNLYFDGAAGTLEIREITGLMS